MTAGTRGRVTAVTTTPANRVRLMELGLLVGTTVELVRIAPLGDPLEIRVRGYGLVLRRQEADQIWISPASTN